MALRGGWRKNRFDLGYLPLILCFLPISLLLSIISLLRTSYMFKDYGFCPQGAQYCLLAEMFVNYVVCLVLLKQKAKQLILPSKFLSGAVT